jgi:hypothetical protein
MKNDKPNRPKQDRLLKQLPLSERKRQMEIRRLIVSDQMWRRGV